MTAAASLTLRPVTDADLPTLRELYAEARAADLALLIEPVRSQILDLQLQAQRTDYQHRYPDALDELILAGGEVVGRCWTALTEHELRLLDLAVRISHRRRGVASAMLTELLGRAGRACVPLTLSVRPDNTAARALYRRHRFVHRTGPTAAAGRPAATGAVTDHLELVHALSIPLHEG